jgi:hypothetical protein
VYNGKKKNLKKSYFRFLFTLPTVSMRAASASAGADADGLRSSIASFVIVRWVAVAFKLDAVRVRPAATQLLRPRRLSRAEAPPKMVGTADSTRRHRCLSPCKRSRCTVDLRPITWTAPSGVQAMQEHQPAGNRSLSGSAVLVRIELKVVTDHSANLQLCFIADVLPTPATEDRVPGLREFFPSCVAPQASFACS